MIDVVKKYNHMGAVPTQTNPYTFPAHKTQNRSKDRKLIYISIKQEKYLKKQGHGSTK